MGGSDRKKWPALEKCFVQCLNPSLPLTDTVISCIPSQHTEDVCTQAPWSSPPFYNPHRLSFLSNANVNDFSSAVNVSSIPNSHGLKETKKLEKTTDCTTFVLPLPFFFFFYVKLRLPFFCAMMPLPPCSRFSAESPASLECRCCILSQWVSM